MVRAIDRLAARFRRWALGWTRTIQHAVRPPAMVRTVMFVNYATYLGKHRDELSTEDGPVWMAVSVFGADPYRLDTCGTREEVLERAGELCTGALPPVILLDRSLLRGYGARNPSHPAHHSSFSLWVRMNDDERLRLASSEVMERAVSIRREAYV